MKKTVILIQARSTSTRLPGKIYLPIGNCSVLEMCYQRCFAEAETYVIGPKNDNRLIDFCDQKYLRFIGGSLHDVVNRYYEAAKFLEAETIVRITSDCPLIVPERIREMIQFHNGNNCGWTTNWPSCADGHDIDIFSFEVLKQLNENSTEREHVGLCLKNNWGFRKSLRGTFLFVKYQEAYLKEWYPKLSIDTIEDYNRIVEIYKKMEELAR